MPGGDGDRAGDAGGEGIHEEPIFCRLCRAEATPVMPCLYAGTGSPMGEHGQSGTELSAALGEPKKPPPQAKVWPVAMSVRTS